MVYPNHFFCIESLCAIHLLIHSSKIAGSSKDQMKGGPNDLSSALQSKHRHMLLRVLHEAVLKAEQMEEDLER